MKRSHCICFLIINNIKDTVLKNDRSKTEVDQKKQPFKAAIEKDKSYFEKDGAKALIELLVATHIGLAEMNLV